MQQTVAFSKPIPAPVHHLACPDRPVRMGHGARFARRARGIDEIGQPVGVAHLERGSLMRGQRVELCHDRTGQRIG